LDLSRVYDMFIVTDRLAEGIDKLERCMRSIEQIGPLHAIVGRSFMGQLDEATAWLTEFHDRSAEQFAPTLVTAEMCEFDINPQCWDVAAFAFSTPLDEALDDLGMWETISDPLVLKGMEDLQQGVCASADAKNLATVAGLLVQLHMMNLLGSARKRADAVGHPLSGTPFIVNVHDSDAYYMLGMPEGLEPPR
jgi:hypothetical protein